MAQELVKHRVVVTGLRLVTPLGNTVEATWAGLMAGRVAAGAITKFDASDFPVRFACEVKDFDPLDYVEKRPGNRSSELKTTSRYLTVRSVVSSSQSFCKRTPNSDGVMIVAFSEIPKVDRLWYMRCSYQDEPMKRRSA